MPRPRSHERGGEKSCTVLLPDVVAKQQILIAKEQLSIGHDGWRPDLSLLSRQLGLLGNRETAALVPADGARVDQHQRPVALAVAIQEAVRTRQATFAETILVRPYLLPVANSWQTQPFGSEWPYKCPFTSTTPPWWFFITLLR